MTRMVYEGILLTRCSDMDCSPHSHSHLPGWSLSPSSSPCPQFKRGNGYQSPGFWTAELEKDIARSVSPVVTKSKPPIPSDHSVDHRPRGDPPVACYFRPRDCQYRDIKEYREKYGPIYNKLCEYIVRGRDTCLLGTCLKKPLLPFSIALSEANKSWSRDGPPNPTNHIWVEVGCKKHVKRVKLHALLLFTTRSLFDMYCDRIIECSHRCHFAMCVNIFHILLEAGWINIDRKDCAKRAEWLMKEKMPVPEFCDKHNPPCLLQMEMDDLDVVAQREFSLLNHVIIGDDNLPSLNWFHTHTGEEAWPQIHEEQIGSWLPRGIGKEFAGTPAYLRGKELNVGHWEGDRLLNHSLDIFITETYTRVEAQRILSANSQRGVTEIFFRSLLAFNDGKILFKPEDKDLLDLTSVNKASSFDGVSNRYHCAFCYGDRAKMCCKPTAVVEQGFDDFRCVLQHIFDNHVEYSNKRKLTFLADEIGQSKGVRAAFRGVFGCESMNTDWGIMKKGKMPPSLQTFIEEREDGEYVFTTQHSDGDDDDADDEAKEENEEDDGGGSCYDDDKNADSMSIETRSSVA